MLLFLPLAILINCEKENLPVISILTECNGQGRCEANSDSVTIIDSVFDSIFSINETDGGSVSLMFCVFTCKGSTFNNCSTSQNGGAIYYYNQKQNSKKATISNCNFTECHAGLKGGAVYFHQSKHEINEFINCTFESNYANSKEAGNNLYAFSQSILIQGCTFANNDPDITGPLLVLQNSCNNDFAWSCIITCCSFIYSIDENSTSSEIVNAVQFLGGTSLKPIEISKTCFIADSKISNLQYIKSSTPLSFENYNVFSVSQENAISCSNVNYNGDIDYDGHECIIKLYIPPSTSIPTCTPSPPATFPKATPKPTKTPSQSPKPTESPKQTDATISISNIVSIPIVTPDTDDDNNDDNTNGKLKLTMNQFIMYIGIAFGGFIVVLIIIIVVFVIIMKKRSYPTVIVNDNSEAVDSNTEYLKNQQLADDI